MHRLSLQTDAQAADYIGRVIDAMCRLFDIPEDEAVRRVNYHWRGQTISGPNSMIYHESYEDLARFVYYGPDVMWWRGEAGLKPREIS